MVTEENSKILSCIVYYLSKSFLILIMVDVSVLIIQWHLICLLLLSKHLLQKIHITFLFKHSADIKDSPTFTNDNCELLIKCVYFQLIKLPLLKSIIWSIIKKSKGNYKANHSKWKTCAGWHLGMTQSKFVE